MRSDYERFNQDIPEDLYPPQLIDGSHSFYNAFWDLDSERAIGMQPGRIPYSAIRKYAMNHGISDSDVFIRIIMAMDKAYLSHNSGGDDKTMTREEFRRVEGKNQVK